jgi:hypothetical protein
MGRYGEILTVLIAALAVPACLAVYPGRSGDIGYAVTALGSAFVSFCAVLVLRAPAYAFPKEWRWTAFWTAPVVGFCVATMAWSAANLLTALVLIPPPLFSLAALGWLTTTAWPFGPDGAVVAAFLCPIGQFNRTQD